MESLYMRLLHTVRKIVCDLFELLLFNRNFSAFEFNAKVICFSSQIVIVFWKLRQFKVPEVWMFRTSIINTKTS